MFKTYVTIAARVLSRNKLYTTINVLGLALGICGCIIIWLVGKYELSFDRFHPQGDRIYRVGGAGKPGERKDAEVLPPAPDAIRRSIPGLEDVTAFFPLYQGRKVSIPVSGKPAVQFDATPQGQDMPGTIIADGNYFSIFKYQWLAGSPAVAMQRPFTVVLTESRAQRYFGPLSPAAVIGKEVIYQDSLHVYVGGVVRDWKKNTDLPYTDFISWPTIASSFLKNVRHMDDWSPHHGGGMYYWPTCFVRLVRGVNPAQVDSELNRSVARQVVTDPRHPYRMQLQALSDIHFNNDYNDNLRKAHLPTLYALTGIALFILILAAVNFINLSTAQSLQRAKEIGVRKVLGSGRGSLIGQFLIETGLLTTVAVVIAALSVRPAMSFFRDYIPEGVRFHPFDPVNFFFLLGVTAVVTLLAGFYPAKVLAGYLPVLSLKGSGAQRGGEKWLLRKSLIVFQFTISLVFIIVTLVIGNQIRYMLNTDYGFKTDATVTVNAGGWRDTTRKINVLEQRYKQLPGIAAVIKEADPPVGWGMTFQEFTYKGKELGRLPAQVYCGDENFVPFYHMRLVAGRNIRHSDSLTEWVINETTARRLGFMQPSAAVGQFLFPNDTAAGIPIVGVVADFHEGSFKDPIRPVVIGHDPRSEHDLGIRLASAGKSVDNVKATLDQMKKIYEEFYPRGSFHTVFLDESISNLYYNEQQTASLVRVAMGLAIFISCMGLFGLSLFTAERRAGEIGIRKVLGATTADIAAMLNKDFLHLVLLALLIASPIAWILAHRWLQDFAYRVPVTGWVFILAGLSAIALALVTVSWQSIRAAMASPVKSLKTE